ncbi:hypothetical protein [Nonomuraea sp. NPDC050202]|uniref:hypothetical protein n=1 Tax=Nonomuraea sp. NPDC050202 TaxID=3155035 RepID=UPI0033F0D0B7
MTDTHDRHPRDAPRAESAGAQDAGSGEPRTPVFEPPHFFPHPEPPRPGYFRIAWGPSVGRGVRARIRGHTCECLPTIYELLAIGGLVHIRRTERTPRGERVRESPWVRTAQGLALWAALLEGRAR